MNIFSGIEKGINSIFEIPSTINYLLLAGGIAIILVTLAVGTGYTYRLFTRETIAIATPMATIAT